MAVRQNWDEALLKILEEYGDEAEEAVTEAVEGVTKETAKRLRQTAPKDTGQYAKGWTSRTEKGRLGASGTVYNGKKPGLAHLLERGRAAGTSGGYPYPAAPAKPHIEDAAAWAEGELVRRIEEAL